MEPHSDMPMIMLYIALINYISCWEGVLHSKTRGKILMMLLCFNQDFDGQDLLESPMRGK